MPQQENAAEFAALSPSGEERDPELEELPEPRRPGRTLTLGAMAVTAIVAVAMSVLLHREALYALSADRPSEIGELIEFDPSAGHTYTWVHGEALLGTTGAIRYSRPLESDTFRLAPVAGNEKIWVEVRVPAGMEGPRFVPPTSFVGRLIPMSRAGLRHAGLPAEARRAAGHEIPAGAWLLVDGESPNSLRWALGLVFLFLGFAAFNFYGLYRLLRPVRDDDDA